MPIKKRRAALKSYHEYRKVMWETLPRERFHFHKSCYITEEGTSVNLKSAEIVLQPKADFSFRDIWHCGSNPTARQVAIDILKYPDIRRLDLKGTWVWVEWSHTGQAHMLPGQWPDGREKILG